MLNVVNDVQHDKFEALNTEKSCVTMIGFEEVTRTNNSKWQEIFFSIGAIFVYISATFFWIWHLENMHFVYKL